MKSEGSEIQNVTNDILEDYSPDWSTDGNWLAYSSGTSKQYDVWLINLITKAKVGAAEKVSYYFW